MSNTPDQEQIYQLQAELGSQVVTWENLPDDPRVRVVPLSELTGEEGLAPGEYKFVLLRQRITDTRYRLSGFGISSLPLTESHTDLSLIEKIRLKRERRMMIFHRHIACACRFGIYDSVGGFLTIDDDGNISIDEDERAGSVGSMQLAQESISDQAAIAQRVSEVCGVCIIDAELLKSIKAVEESTGSLPSL